MACEDCERFQEQIKKARDEGARETVIMIMTEVAKAITCVWGSEAWDEFNAQFMKSMRQKMNEEES